VKFNIQNFRILHNRLQTANCLRVTVATGWQVRVAVIYKNTRPSRHDMWPSRLNLSMQYNTIQYSFNKS